VRQLQGSIKAAAEEWASKFRAVQNATGRDAFHGVCLRFDRASSGRLAVADFKKVRPCGSCFIYGLAALQIWLESTGPEGAQREDG
jgi:hypothetical protein